MLQTQKGLILYLKLKLGATITTPPSSSPSLLLLLIRVVVIAIVIINIRKGRLREGKGLASGHTASQGRAGPSMAF